MRKRIFVVLSGLLMSIVMLAENTRTIDVTFSEFPKGTSYAENEKHDLGEGLVIYTTKCLFTEQLRIYASTTYDGYVISDPLPGSITSMSFNMGYSKDVLNVYGSTDKENWTLIKGIETTSTSYKNYSLEFPQGKEYTCFKLDVKGDQQIRIVSMSVTYIKGDEDNDNGSSEDDSGEGIIVSSPTFNPASTSFSTESIDVTITADEGCEVYYTTDGSTPSYTDATDYIGTKGNTVTIHASESPVTLKAIAVNPATGVCSNISSATYTYTDPSTPEEEEPEITITNDGSKAKPYTVAEMNAMPISKTQEGGWVKGVICGTIRDNKVVTEGFKEYTNIALGDATTYVSVQLPEGDIRDAINLKDHPYLQGKELLIKGDIEIYSNVLGVKSPTQYEITYNVPINSYGYASLFLDIPVTMPTGSTAYYCTTNGENVNLLPIETIVPDSTGIIISSTPNTTCTLTYSTAVNVDEASISSLNQLVGYTKDTIVNADGYAYYALNAKDGVVGFFIPQTATDATDATKGFTAKANKAYLRVNDATQATMFVICRKNEDTHIEPITHLSDEIIYDLQGRIVSTPIQGMYIQGGKKIMIK